MFYKICMAQERWDGSRGRVLANAFVKPWEGWFVAFLFLLVSARAPIRPSVHLVRPGPDNRGQPILGRVNVFEKSFQLILYTLMCWNDLLDYLWLSGLGISWFFTFWTRGSVRFFVFFSSNLLPSSVRAAGIYGMLSGQVGGLGIDAMPATDCWRETRLKYYSIFDLNGRHWVDLPRKQW